GVHGQAGDVLAVDEGLAGLGLHEAREAVEGRGLPPPVGAQEPPDLAPGDLERDAAHDPPPPVGLADLPGLELHLDSLLGKRIQPVALPSASTRASGREARMESALTAPVHSPSPGESGPTRRRTGRPPERARVCSSRS